MMHTSHIVRARAFREVWFLDRARELCEPVNIHRKLWEFCVIAQIYYERLGAGGRVLGFGVGREPMAAWFASRGASVIATDRPDETAEWSGTGQHATDRDQLEHQGVCSGSAFDEHVRFMPMDMNAIPEFVRGGQFDLTWSAGSFEHIGGIKQSLDFFCNQMACLRPGGLAVHTTEFNPDNSKPTLESPDLVLFREQELRELADRLDKQGDRLWPLDLEGGDEEADRHVDRPPYGFPHLRLAIGDYVTTSILLVAQGGTG